jgi:hypothetical protein
LFYEPARIRGLKLVDACADRRLLVSCWSLRVLLPITSSTCLAEAGCLAGGPGERDWMRPSVGRVSGRSWGSRRPGE